MKELEAQMNADGHGLRMSRFWTYLRSSAFICGFIFVLRARAEPDPNSPEAELAALHVLDGYEVKLFASEADGIAKPLQMRWDERGRLWVACTTAYPQVEP